MRITRLNHAVLYVRDAARSAAFYGRVLGFEEVIADPSGGFVFLRASGSVNHHDLAVFAVGPQAPGPVAGGVGLYHLAWEVATLAELEQARDALIDAGALIGASDHGVNKSLYARDVDGNEFEVMWLVPPTRWGSDAHEAIIRPLDLGEERRRFGDRAINWSLEVSGGAAEVMS